MYFLRFKSNFWHGNQRRVQWRAIAARQTIYKPRSSNSVIPWCTENIGMIISIITIWSQKVTRFTLLICQHVSEQETWLAETTVRLHFHSSGYGLWMLRLDRTDHSWVAGHQGTMFIQYLQLLRVPFGVVLIALTEAEEEAPWPVFFLALWRVAEVAPRSH